MISKIDLRKNLFTEYWVYIFFLLFMFSFTLLYFEQSKIQQVKAAKGAEKREQKESSLNQSKEVKGDNSEKVQDQKEDLSSRGNEGPKENTKTEIITNTEPRVTYGYSSETASNTDKKKEGSKPVEKISASLIITGLGSFDVELEKEGENSFEVLKRASIIYDFDLEYQEFDWGVMVTKIGDLEAQGTFYWALYYNGGYSEVGASELVIFDKDKIEWRYESWL